MSPHPLLVHAALLLVSLIFGVNYVTMKIVVESVPVGAWVFYRIAAAALFLSPFLLLRRRHWPAHRHVPPLLVAALLGVVLNGSLFAAGLQRTTPGHSAVINTSIPVLTLCLAVLGRQERFSPAKLVAIASALTGVCVLLRVDDLLRAGTAPRGEALLGDLMTFGNALSFSAFLVLMRRIGPGVDPIVATAFCFAAGTPMVAVIGQGSIGEQSLAAMLQPHVLPWAVYAVLGATVLTYLLNNWALRHTHSSRVALYIYVQPLVATSLSMVVGHDMPDARFVTAALLIFGGILVETIARSLRLRRHAN